MRLNPAHLHLPLFASLILCSPAQAHGLEERHLLFALALYFLPYVIGLMMAKSGARLRYAGMCLIALTGSLVIFYGGVEIGTAAAPAIVAFGFLCPWALPFYGAFLRFNKNT